MAISDNAMPSPPSATTDPAGWDQAANEAHYHALLSRTEEQFKTHTQDEMAKEREWTKPEKIHSLALKGGSMNLDIPTTLDGALQQFAQGKIGREDFIAALGKEDAHLKVGSRDAAEFKNLIADQVEEARRQGVPVHAAYHLSDPNSEAAKREGAFWKPIQEEFRKKTGIDAEHDPQSAIDHGYAAFGQNWIKANHKEEEYAQVESALAKQYRKENPSPSSALSANGAADPGGLGGFLQMIEHKFEDMLAPIIAAFNHSGVEMAGTHSTQPPANTPVAQASSRDTGRGQG